VDPVGILTLVFDKPNRRLAHSIKNLEMDELRGICQQFLRMVEDAIFETERYKIKNTKGG